MYLNKEEMKFSILYTLKKYSAPIAMSRLFEILTWDKEVMEYFDLSEMLYELIEGDYIIKKYYRNSESYALSQKGEDTCAYFTARVPKSIRDRIDDAIGKIRFNEISDPNQIRGEVIPINDTQFSARCTIIDNKTPLMELTLNMGSASQADDVSKYFEKNAEKIYQGILKLCIPDLQKKSE